MEKNIGRKILVIGLISLFLGASATIGVSAYGTKMNIGAIPAPVDRDWSDAFDTYELGQPLDGLDGNDGGWKGWDNSPAAAGIISDNETRSSPYSLEVRGPTDQVYQFDQLTGEWVFTAWQFIPTGQSGGTYGGTYFIMLNHYVDGGGQTVDKWSVQIHFDNVNDVVESENDTNEWPTLPLIYNQWVQLRVKIDLVNDWFKFYYNNQLLVEKAWTAGVNNDNVGNLTFDALDLFADGSTSVYYDDLSFAPPNPDLIVDASGPYSCELGQAINFTGIATGGVEPVQLVLGFR